MYLPILRLADEPILACGRPRTAPAFGLIRPQVLLPRESREWAPERIESVTLHEEAHVRARDPIVLLLSHLLCAALWFHPLTWLAAARLRAESELAADEAVVRAGITPSAYATHLLECAKDSLPLPYSNRFAAVAIVREPGIARRIEASSALGLPKLCRRCIALPLPSALILFLATRAAVAPIPRAASLNAYSFTAPAAFGLSSSPVHAVTSTNTSATSGTASRIR